MENTEQSDKGCCKDKTTFLKDNSAQKLSENNLQMLQLFFVAIPVSLSELPTIVFPLVTEGNPTSNAPPRTHGVAIYIFKRSYLI